MQVQAPAPAGHVSPRAFAMWWLAILLLHGVAAAFFGVSALFYAQLEGTYLDSCLQFYGIGMTTEHYSTIAWTMALLAIPHAVLILKMFVVSLASRSLAFTLDSRKARAAAASKSTTSRRAMSKNKSGGSRKAGGGTRSQNCVTPSGSATLQASSLLARVRAWFTWPTWMMTWHRVLLDRNGLLGVDGQYFHVILFVRELVETSLQTIQAYRMSMYLPRMWLNRFYVAVIVLNCWLTPLVYFAFKRSETTKRLLCLACDCALDLAASVLIPCAILVSYVGAYDLEIEGFDILMWYDDRWFMQAHNEFQMLLVVSWRDLGSRIVFSLGMLACMCDIKDLIEGVCYRSGTRVSPATTALTTAFSDSATVSAPPTNSRGPTVDALREADAVAANAQRSSTIQMLQRRLRTASIAIVTTKYGSRAYKLAHAVMFVWGAVILALHIYAEPLAQLSQCLLQVRPWGKSAPSCVLVLLNCHANGIRGAESDVDAQWSVVEADMVERVIVRHCPAFEMPAVLQQFSRLTSLKVYNSTIASWRDSAALTTVHHPQLASLFFVRVNMSDDGELPPGLLSPSFPSSVIDVEFCVTNLRTLPSDLDTTWPMHVGLYVELSALTEVPPAAMRLEPIYLSVFGNPITELPSAVFEVEGMTYLHVGSTHITSLPATVTSYSSTLTYVYLTDTPVSYFPDWIDTPVALGIDQSSRSVYASGTPYCEQLPGILNGTRLAFDIRDNEASTVSPPSVLMDASVANQDLLYRSVSCKAEYSVPFFPLEFEDAMSGLVE